MKFTKSRAVFFSATGTTKKIVTEITDGIAKNLFIQADELDFTIPAARKEKYSFSPGDIVVLGVPVIAGRVPNVLLKFLDTIEGNGAAAIPVVLFGNRNYDDALIELRDILENGGFRTIAAAAFVGEHSFSEILAKGRPDGADLLTARSFAANVAKKAAALTGSSSPPIHVDGAPFPYRGYYQPCDRHGNHIDIRKVKPLTNSDCDKCTICAQICPMGSINPDDVSVIAGICIKCCACIKRCPKKAKYFDDEGYLYHKRELEEIYTGRAEPQLFI